MANARRRLRTTTGIALALHVAAAAGLSAVRVPPPVVRPPEPTFEIAIADPEPAPAPQPQPQPQPTSAPTPESTAEPAARAALALASRERPTDPAPEMLAPGPPMNDAPASEAAGAPVMLVMPGYRLAGTSPTGRVLAPGPEESAAARAQRETKEAEARVEQALRQPARDRERELGLGPEGPVLKALGEAASEGATDVTGRAVFLAVADGTGAVLSVDLVECNGGRPGWSDAARAALAKLRGVKLRVPSAAKRSDFRARQGMRAEMRIEITSAWKMPSGHDPGTDVNVLGLPVAKGEGGNSTKVTIFDPIPKVRMVELSKDVKVPQVEITILGTNGDPVNIGAKPRRIVHTRLVESKFL